jgi:hypothetical protein
MSEELPGHLSDQEINDYSSRAMSPAELIVADDHLAICDACSLRVSGAGRLEDKTVILSRDSTTNREAAIHLGYEQLAAYLDNELDEVEREISDVHLQVCQACSEELGDLRAFKAELQFSVNEQQAQAPSTPALQVPFWRRPLKWSPLQFAAAATICALLGGLVWSIWKFSSSKTEVAQSPVPQITVAPSPSTSVQQSVPSPSPAADHQIIVTLNDDGRTITVDAKGNVEGLEELPQSYRQTVSLALTTGNLNIPSEALQLTGNAGVLMGGHSEGVAFALLHPVGIVVRTTRPTLSWQRLEGANGYIVNIYDTSFSKIVTSAQLSGTQWSLTSSLPAGHIYLWQVTAMKGGIEIKSPIPPAPPAKFKVLEQSKAGELERMRRAYPNSHLVLGTLYAKAGLLAEAEREFRALVAANPQSPIAQKLLRDVRR